MRWYRILIVPVHALALAAWRFHPIHAARVELVATTDGALTATVRAYRDDFQPGTSLPAIGAYLDRVLVVTDASGTRVVLHPTSVEPEGDRLRIILAGRTTAALSGGHIALSLLQDKYPDQVDVVDARIGGRRAQLVFLRGDKPQSLP